MKKLLAKLRSSMSINIIGAIVILLLIFGVLVGVLGFVSFTNAFKREYAISTYHMADTATALINGDHLEDYLAGEETEEYLKTKEYLDTYCHRMSVSLLYVILVDQSDYGRFVSIFNSVDNTVDDSTYTEWELGHKRDTTNDEYRRKYKELYDQEAAFETIYRFKTNDGSHPHITTMVPVKNSDGETAAILCIQRPIRELNEARRPYLINIAVATSLLAIAISAFIVYYFRRQVVAPIRKAADEATRFARENTKGESLCGISKFAEISSLTTSIDTMETDMVNYMENLTRITAQKERIDTELHMATLIQESMLPRVFPPYPDIKAFDIYASMDPAREVGGDFYDFFLIDEDHLGLVMADVSGKGVPAALFMMISKVIIQSCAMLGRSAAEILNKTNEALCSNNQTKMFVTVWMGILEISTGRLSAANAGHEYPALCRRGGQFQLYRDKHGFVIGGIPRMVYQEYEIQLEPGDKLFLYTDGVPEATDARQQMLGTQGMLDALNTAPDAPPREILEQVRKAVDVFVNGAEQFDDLTMLCIRYNGHQIAD